MSGSINTNRPHINQSFIEYTKEIKGTNKSEFVMIAKYQENGKIDVRPYLDPSDGGTLEQKSNNQILTIGTIIIAAIIVITLLLNMFGPVLKMLALESLSKLRRIKPKVNQQTSLQSNQGMEANLHPNADLDCNPTASLQSSGESDPSSNQQTSLQSNQGMEANLHPNADLDCNPTASLQSSEESDPSSIDNHESKVISDNLVSNKKGKKEEYENE